MINLTVYHQAVCMAKKDFYSEVACAEYLKLNHQMTNQEGYELFDDLEDYGYAKFSKNEHLVVLTIRP